MIARIPVASAPILIVASSEYFAEQHFVACRGTRDNAPFPAIASCESTSSLQGLYLEIRNLSS
jgi:hypothetical protein